MDDLNWVKNKNLDLFIESYSSAYLIVQIRGFSSVEQIIANHETTGDRYVKTSTIPISEFPIMLTARTVETGVSRGECFVKVSVRAEGIVVALLFAGYVTDAGAPVYPGGKIESSVEGPGLIRMITGTDPAAGNEISETVPTGARWRFISLSSVFIASADVANRTPKLKFGAGMDTVFSTGESAVLTASQTAFISFADVGQEDISAILSLVQCVPANLILKAGDIIGTNTGGIQAADNWLAPTLLVEEWIEP